MLDLKFIGVVNLVRIEDLFNVKVAHFGESRDKAADRDNEASSLVAIGL